METITTVLAPDILNHFDSALLNAKKRTPLDSLESLLDKVRTKLKRRLRDDHYEKIKEIEEYIERIKKEKEERKGAFQDKTQRPFYCLRCNNGRNQKILYGFQYGRSFSIRYASK